MRRKVTILTVGLLLGAMFFTCNVKAQEEESSPVDLGLDIYSSYIWRGAKFGSGPAFQPWVEGAFGDFSIGAWGSVSSSADEALEMDLYASYSVGGLGIALTDYYFGGSWLSDSTHFIEPALSFEAGDFSIMGAYMFTPDFSDGDIYFELGYSLGAIDLALGVGDGAYTDDGEIMLCNLTLGTSKEVAITESFSLPLSGAVTLNPSTGGFFITVGASF